MEIIKDYSPNYSSRNGQIPLIIVSHITEGGFKGAISWLKNKQSQASSHFVISRKGEIVQLVRIEDMAWTNGTSTDRSSSVFYGHAKSELVRNKGGNANAYSVTIEHEGVFSETQGALTEVQYQATLWLHKYIISEVKRIYGHTIKPTRYYLMPHSDVTPKTRTNCAGRLFPWDRLIKGLAGGEAPKKGEIMYRVQVGAYRDKSNAEKKAEALRKQGHEVYIVNEGEKNVNKPALKSLSVIAKEVIDGKWGNGDTRKSRLKKAGYDYNAVQREVNRLLGGR